MPQFTGSFFEAVSSFLISAISMASPDAAAGGPRSAPRD
jgi:hypothetical protein